MQHDPSEPPPIPEILTKPTPRPAEKPKPSGTANTMSDVGFAVGVGLDFLFTLAAGAFLGYLFDRWRGGGHIGMFVGVAIGMALATFRILRRLNAQDAAGKTRPPGA